MTGPRDDGSQGHDEIPQGRVRRAAPLARLTARTAGETVIAALRQKVTGSSEAETHIRSAERYAELLGRSKGALMKAGQWVSFMSLGPAVPLEFQSAYRTSLERLRANAPPMDGELAREVLEGDLGRRSEELFAEFDWEPLAAASIGQVHSARLHDGREVAVKIQYPGVAAAIRADLKNGELLATFLHLMISMSPKRMRMDPRAMADEIQGHIYEELDYRLEARRQSRFADLYRGHPFIHIPDVIGELSTATVLTQDLVRGIPWADALVADQGLRDRWGEAIFRFAYGSVNHFRIYNADPHPGNYLFHDDGSVSFLDFGCVVPVTPEMTDIVPVMIRACLAGDVIGHWKAVVNGGFWQESDSVTPQEVYEYWREGYRWYWGEQPFTVTPEWVDAVVERRNSPSGPSGNVVRNLRAP